MPLLAVSSREVWQIPPETLDHPGMIEDSAAASWNSPSNGAQQMRFSIRPALSKISTLHWEWQNAAETSVHPLPVVFRPTLSPLVRGTGACHREIEGGVFEMVHRAQLFISSFLDAESLTA